MPDYAKKLRVYGGLKMKSDGKQHRIVVATNSKSSLARILGVGIYIVNMWWAKTGNKMEIAEATKCPHTLVDMGAK